MSEIVENESRCESESAKLQAKEVYLVSSAASYF